MALKPTNREIKSEQNRKKLLKSALDLFSKYGYENVTVNDIVTNVSMTKGSFYNLFRSKSDLVIYRSEVLGEEVMKSYSHLFEDPDYAHRNSVEKIQDFIQIMIKTSTASSNQAFLSQMFISVMSDPPEDAKNYYEQHQTDEIVKAAICEGQLKGQIRRDIDCDEILRAIHVFQRSLLLEWCYKKGKYDIVERNKDAISIFCQGIKNPE